MIEYSRLKGVSYVSSVESRATVDERQYYYQGVLEGRTIFYEGQEVLYQGGVMTCRVISPEEAERRDLAKARKVFGLEPENASLIVSDLTDPASRQEKLVLPE